MENYNLIFNPHTKEYTHLFTDSGQSTLNTYINQIGGWTKFEAPTFLKKIEVPTFGKKKLFYSELPNISALKFDGTTTIEKLSQKAIQIQHYYSKKKQDVRLNSELTPEVINIKIEEIEKEYTDNHLPFITNVEKYIEEHYKTIDDEEYSDDDPVAVQDDLGEDLGSTAETQRLADKAKAAEAEKQRLAAEADKAKAAEAEKQRLAAEADKAKAAEAEKQAREARKKRREERKAERQKRREERKERAARKAERQQRKEEREARKAERKARAAEKAREVI